MRDDPGCVPSENSGFPSGTSVPLVPLMFTWPDQDQANHLMTTRNAACIDMQDVGRPVLQPSPSGEEPACHIVSQLSHRTKPSLPILTSESCCSIVGRNQVGADGGALEVP